MRQQQLAFRRRTAEIRPGRNTSRPAGGAGKHRRYRRPVRDSTAGGPPPFSFRSPLPVQGMLMSWQQKSFSNDATECHYACPSANSQFDPLLLGFVPPW